MTYTDDTIIPFGPHKGKPLADVPDRWLLAFFKAKMSEIPDHPLIAYIQDNLDAIKQNIAHAPTSYTR